MSNCDFVNAWAGKCGNVCGAGETKCAEHKNLKCSSCGSPATRTCDETMGLVCGAPLCDDCEHEIAPNGTNGYSGKHIRKGTQKYKCWLEQSEEEQLQGSYLMLKRSVNSQLKINNFAKNFREGPIQENIYIGELRSKITEMEIKHPQLKGLEE